MLLPRVRNSGIPMVSQKQPRPTLMREAAMLLKGKTRIMQSGDWLTADAVCTIAQLNMDSPRSVLDAWVSAGALFTLQHDDIDYFPLYGLDPATAYHPRSNLAAIIATLASKKEGWGMAFWFGSANTYLDGQMPKDVLADDPEAVLDAAKAEVSELFF